MTLTLPFSLLLAAGSAPELPADTTARVRVEIQEWDVPWADTRPRDPYVAPDGRIWFVGQRADYMGVLDPATGEFSRFPMNEGAGPHNVIVDDEGTLWYAGNRDQHIGRMDPGTGEIRRFETPDPARDPHTLIFGRQGEIWFTAQGGNAVGRFVPATGEVRVTPVPTPRARPYGIVVDERNRAWFNEFGTNKIGMIEAEGMRIREFTLPREEARTRRIALTSDGGVWYVDYAAGFLGRLDPADGSVREWRVPAGAEARPYAMTVDAEDRIWLVESGVSPNRLVGFDPRTGEFFSRTEIPSGGGTVRHMVFHEPSRAIWFGTDTNTIGRALIPMAAAAHGQHR
jgi:virginiamycin B lyase